MPAKSGSRPKVRGSRTSAPQSRRRRLQRRPSSRHSSARSTHAPETLCAGSEQRLRQPDTTSRRSHGQRHAGCSRFLRACRTLAVALPPAGIDPGLAIRAGEFAAEDMVGGLLAGHDAWTVQVAVGDPRQSGPAEATEGKTLHLRLGKFHLRTADAGALPAASRCHPP